MHKNTQKISYELIKHQQKQIHSDSVHVYLNGEISIAVNGRSKKVYIYIYIIVPWISHQTGSATQRLFSGFAVFDGRSTQRRFATGVNPTKVFSSFHFRGVTTPQKNLHDANIHHEWVNAFHMEKYGVANVIFFFRSCYPAFFVGPQVVSAIWTISCGWRFCNGRICWRTMNQKREVMVHQVGFRLHIYTYVYIKIYTHRLYLYIHKNMYIYIYHLNLYLTG